ncbi:MAG: [ribosomal protein S18]-alanine N-acetyltransferase [Actinomycetota bacterium]|jgi:ribosomal-protein-alanine N-acetyltransferase|nr:[ribosomal protein S18]-alanine N-acetyltransferase [Actinomycetota bacterium]
MTSGPPVTVAPLRWWHVAEVAALERRLFPDDAWSAEQFWQELAQPTRSYLVASVDDAVAGYAGIFVMPPDSDLQTIAVQPERHGAGLATAMLRALIAEARQAGCTHMLLEVRADNDRAIALYARFGFSRISTRRRYYPDGADADIMRLDLGSADGEAP